MGWHAGLAPAFFYFVHGRVFAELTRFLDNGITPYKAFGKLTAQLKFITKAGHSLSKYLKLP